MITDDKILNEDQGGLKILEGNILPCCAPKPKEFPVKYYYYDVRSLRIHSSIDEILNVEDEQSLTKSQDYHFNIKMMSQVSKGVLEMQINAKAEVSQMQATSNFIDSVYLTHTLKHFQ